MKSYLLLFAFALTLFSCEKDDVIADEEPPVQEEVEVIKDKKGACFTYKGATWSSRVSRLKAHWHYSWGHELKEEEPDNVEYVPMFWGKQVTDEKIAYLKQLKEEDKIQYILGFNEPDGEDQANMTVDEAIALWPKLEEIGLPLGSPAPVGGTNEWMTEFMSKADAQGLRIDFIAMHKYPGPNADAFLQKVKEIHDLYKRPIWITEFAVADWNANTVEENKHSPEEVLAFMKAVLPKLDQLDYVHRYAWFSGQTTNKALAPSALFDAEDNLTPLGEYYANHVPNAEIGPGKDKEVDPVDEVAGNLVKNGTFESGEVAPWSGFKNGVVGAATTEPHSGAYTGRIEANDGSLYQVITVEPGATYEVTFYARWMEETSHSFDFAVKEETGDKVKFFTQAVSANADGWTENKVTFTATEQASIRLLWYKGKVDPSFPAFFLDDVVCLKKTE